MANAFTERWGIGDDSRSDFEKRWQKKKGDEIPISPTLPPPRGFLDWLRQPIPTGPGMRAPIWGGGAPNLGMGNIPAGIINNSPIPMLARGLTKVGELEHKVYDWGSALEGAPASAPGGEVSTPPFQLRLPIAPVQGGPRPGASLASSAASPSGGLANTSGASAYRDVIAGIESEGSGDYGAVGPMTNGDQPYGRYQVMGANIPQWTYEALGQNMTPEEFLNNPEAQDAVFDYQFGKYLEMGSPQDAASRWFSGRPLAEAYGSSDVLGTSVPGYVNKFNAALGEGPLPPVAEPYQVGQQPLLPNPEDAPLPSEPDFSSQNAYLDQAAPQRAALPDRFQALLSGLAQANANTDTRGPGAVARLFANWGAGISGAAEKYDVDQTNAENEFQAQQRDFLLRRAVAAGEQEGALRSWRDSAGETGFRNRTADQAASFQNEQAQFQTGEANRKIGFETDAANRESIYNYQTQQMEAQKPKMVNATDKGVTFLNPDGTTSFQPNSAAEMFPGYKEGELPDPLREVQKYSSLIQTAMQSGDVGVVREEILRDSVRDGTAAQIFGEHYEQALDQARDRVSADPALMSDPEAYQAAVQNAVAAQLLQLTLGDDSWVPNAAAMGNPGARIMLQMGGQ